MKTLHFGAGNIGRGFIGKLLADASHQVTFADVNETLIDQLNHRQEYKVHVVGTDQKLDVVRNVAAVSSAGHEVIARIITADLVTTAVGPNILDKIASTLAKGLQARFDAGNLTPLNVIACENMVRGTSHLKQEVLKYLPVAYHATLDNCVGFVDSAVDRIVPPAAANDDPLEVTVESFSEWIVDQTQFKGELPQVAGMEPTDNLMAFVERKLFTLNTGHIVTAYLGKLRGYRTVREAIEDPVIRSKVRRAMEESGAVLVKRYGFDPRLLAACVQRMLGRREEAWSRLEPVLAVAGEDLVAGLARDIELTAQFGHLLALEQSGNKPQALVHLVTLLPRHFALPAKAGVLPMSPE